MRNGLMMTGRKTRPLFAAVRPCGPCLPDERTSAVEMPRIPRACRPTSMPAPGAVVALRPPRRAAARPIVPFPRRKGNAPARRGGANRHNALSQVGTTLAHFPPKEKSFLRRAGQYVGKGMSAAFRAAVRMPDCPWCRLPADSPRGAFVMPDFPVLKTAGKRARLLQHVFFETSSTRRAAPASPSLMWSPCHAGRFF